jgi:hypothetical protein
MTSDGNPTPEWTSEAVVKRLQEKAERGEPTSAQVFFADAVPAAELQNKAQEIIDDTIEKLKLAPDAIKLGKIYPLAKSFSLTTAKPQVFETINSRKDVKTLLESEQNDILPKPVTCKPE